MNQYEALAAHGRGGDSDIALTSSREREMLRRMGGSGTINPYTGLREYKGGSSIAAAIAPPVQTYDASTLNTALTPVSSASTTPTYTAPTETRIVSQTDPLAPSGQSELSRLMRMYGVSTPSMNSYIGADKPVAPTAFSGTAPTALSGRVTQDQINAYNAARDAYNASVGTYNTSIGDYNTALDKYGLNQAQYDLYANEYNKRMQSPVNIYAQQQFGYKGDPALPTDVLLSPTYAQGGTVRGYAEGDIVEVDGEEPIEAPQQGPSGSPSRLMALQAMMQQSYPADGGYAKELAAAREKANAETEAFNQMLTKTIDSPENSGDSKAELYFRLASAFLSPTKTKQGFVENLGMAGATAADWKKGQRENSMEKAKLRLEAQKYKMSGAKEDLTTMRALQLENMKDKRAMALKIMEEYIASGKPQSAAGKAALDMGLKPGTPEYQAEVQRITDMNIQLKNAQVNAAVARTNELTDKGTRLTNKELELKNEREDKVVALGDALSALKEAYSLNPQTFGGTLGDKAWRAVAENTDPKNPQVIATRRVENLLAEQALTKLRATFGGNPTEGERAILLDLQGIGSKSKEERKQVIMRTYQVLKQRETTEKKRLNDLISGKYRLIEEGVPTDAQ